MGSPRQQRAPRNRRALTPANPPLVPQLAMIVDAVGVTTLFLRARIYGQPPNASTNPLAMQLNGIPAIFRTQTGTYPTAANLTDSETQLRLTYASPDLTATETFTVGPYDPAIRTPQGGWMSPGVIALAASPPQQASYTAIVQLDGSIIITYGDPGDIPLVCSQPAGWRNVSQSADLVSWSSVAGIITLNFPSPSASGDTLRYQGPLLGRGGNGRDIVRTDVIAT